jgi:hypothetical protein
MPLYLSKSRFKIATSCPAKLNYVGKQDYVDSNASNDFLLALAEGGFQVGELAKMLYPDGIEVTEERQVDQIRRTTELLNQDNVVIFEGTVQHGDWVARIDVIKKTGAKVQLIEVKSKSFNSLEGSIEEQWRNKRPTPGQKKGLHPINSDMLPYLQDVAFQTLILRNAWPDFDVTPFLMMPDKAERSSIDGLNQKFKLHKTVANGRMRTWSTPVPGTALESLGNPLLKQIDVSSFVIQIIDGVLEYPGGANLFTLVATDWARKFALGEQIRPVIGSQCRSCEFRTDMPDAQHRSGFHECWEETLNTTVADIQKRRPVTSLYWPSAGQIKKLIDREIYWLDQLKTEDLNDKTNPDGLSRDERRLMQVFNQWDANNPFHFEASRWRQAMAGFTYPLHFIDFEGARPALPFTRDKRPFQQVAFQFSHHQMEKDGSVCHASEFIDLNPGIDPSISFLRALHKALTKPGTEQGTVFMWSPYENTVLNELRSELLDQRIAGTAPDDAETLIAFADSLTVRKQGDKVVHRGDRVMVDLCAYADRLFFHPDTQGRSSIKVVLPAVMKASDWLQKRYSKPIYGAPTGMTSRNFPLRNQEGMTWWVADKDGAKNPYKLLPPIFEDISQEELEALDLNEEEALREGGAATTAYARMQFTDVDETIRVATEKALLRYCELDTLAMVMVFEAWREWSN